MKNKMVAAFLGFKEDFHPTDMEKFTIGLRMHKLGIMRSYLLSTRNTNRGLMKDVI